LYDGDMSGPADNGTIDGRSAIVSGTAEDPRPGPEDAPPAVRYGQEPATDREAMARALKSAVDALSRTASVLERDQLGLVVEICEWAHAELNAPAGGNVPHSNRMSSFCALLQSVSQTLSEIMPPEPDSWGHIGAEASGGASSPPPGG
jgi:hypothetical protein